MRRFKRFLIVTFAASICVGVLAALRFITLPWDQAWARRATSLTLSQPGETFTGAELSVGLSRFSANISSTLDYRCTLFERQGSITVDGTQYPVRFIYDKFTGESLVIERDWKTIELFGATGANAELRFLYRDAQDE